VFTQLLQVLLQFAVAVRAANHHQRWTRIAHLDLLTHAALFLPRLYLPQRCTSPSSPARRPRPAPLSLLNQGDIDGELTVALDELFGPVQRIDQPVALPVLALIPALRRFF
jgi:hypothetical protein